MKNRNLLRKGIYLAILVVQIVILQQVIKAPAKVLAQHISKPKTTNLVDRNDGDSVILR